MKAMTDQDIIKKCSPGVRGRVHIELQIVNKLIETANKGGYTLKMEDDDIDMQVYDNDLKTAIFDLDDCYLSIFKGKERLGWVRLIFGNDGYDCLSDYSYTDEMVKFLKPVEEVSDFWGN